MRSTPWLCVLLACLAFVQAITVARAEEWSIPVGGNAFRTSPEPSNSGFKRNGTLVWSDDESVFSLYFHIDRPARLELAINAAVSQGSSRLMVKVANEAFNTIIEGSELSLHAIGSVDIKQVGYVRLDMNGTEMAGDSYAEVRDIVVRSDTKDLVLDYVKNNDGNMFYWGRRGPSVHLRYDVPREGKLRYAYSEITVPEGQDPIGSYYMANGFSEGYFGIQVNGPQERRILFSVWSPFQTDNPRDIPADQRIATLAKGSGVHVGEFGNEGSGGQSYLVYPWKAGTTYCFLTEVEPDGVGNTTYTSWFREKLSDGNPPWRLIASFRRPQTDTHLKGFHSFLESFAPERGYIGRRGYYGNVWVRDIDEQWHECTQARFSVDATGGGRHRLDFSGGAEGDQFFMRNCGFFNGIGKPGQAFARESSAEKQPEIDFDALPRG
jgi:hypothetical protein